MAPGKMFLTLFWSFVFLQIVAKSQQVNALKAGGNGQFDDTNGVQEQITESEDGLGEIASGEDTVISHQEEEGSGITSGVHPDEGIRNSKSHQENVESKEKISLTDSVTSTDEQSAGDYNSEDKGIIINTVGVSNKSNKPNVQSDNEVQSKSTNSKKVNSVYSDSSDISEKDNSSATVEEISFNDCYGSGNQKYQIPNTPLYNDPVYANYLRDLITKSKFEREILHDAVKKGAVCIDGSPPAVYVRHGSGSGKKKWIFFFEGGAWCYTKEECYERSKTALGTSSQSPGYFLGSGLLSANRSMNSHYYNWNVVILDYCDGASFSGNLAEPVIHKGVKLYFRGKRILDHVLKVFLKRGMRSAKHVIVTGRSAGGLAAMLHADYIKKKLSHSSKYHVMSDGGFFLDIKAGDGSYYYRGLIKKLVALHNITGGVDEHCATKNKENMWKCFFPQYFIKDIKSPLFMVNSLYDTWSIASIYGVSCTMWNYRQCDFDQAVSVIRYRRKTVRVFDESDFARSKKGGVFFTSCIAHCTCMDERWNKMAVNKTVMQDAFFNWMTGRHGDNMLIDGEYPDNLTC